jgi:hypothetical protein
MTPTFLSGTKASPPVGLEATFSYNGLVLGDRSNPDRYRILQVSGLDDADLRDSRELLPTQDGETAFTAYYGGRTISLRGIIEAGNMAKVRDMQKALRTAFVSLTEIPLYIYSPGGLADVMFEKVRKSAPIQMAEQQANLRAAREFQITLRASDPWMVTTSLTTSSFSATGSGTLTNLGNFNAVPVIEVTGTSSLVNPTITIGSYSVGFTHSFANGEMFIINVRNRTITNSSGVFKYGKLSTATTWPWPLLLPGANAVSISRSSGSGTIDIKWRSTWM